MIRGLPGVAPAVLLAALLSAGAAHAEPRFTAITSLRCGRCHTSPLGGGKRSAYGALYAMSNLSVAGGTPRADLPGRGGASQGGWLTTALATGEVTSWLAVGADLRLTNRTTFDPVGGTSNSFDTSGGQLYIEVRPWPDRLVIYLDEEISGDGVRTREAWGLVHGPWGSYLRGGRILPPFGLRLRDDAAYTRLVTGATFANPDLGLELGVDLGWMFLSAALTNGSFSGQDEDNLKAIWGLVEFDLGPGRLGLSGAYNPTEAGCRAMGGLLASVALGRLVIQGEVDYLAQRPADSPLWTHQIVGMVEGHLAITRGLSLHAGYEIHDANLELGHDLRQRVRLGLDIFPIRMVAARLGYVLKHAQTMAPSDRADMLEVVLHVYL